MVSKADGRGSGGMQEVRWLEPVRPGDLLTATVEILNTQPSSRHPDRGTVFIGCRMTNQHGRVVMSFHGRGLFGRRHPLNESAGTSPAPSSASSADSFKNAVKVRSTDGVDLNLRMMGGSGPDLLICHATGFHGLAYRPLAQHLADRFTVWALDFRGHGSSGPAPGDDYAWSGMGADVAACAAAISAGRLYGFGHSMGGAALLLAERSTPGTFESLFLYEPIVLPEGFFDAPSANPLAAGARNRREVFNSRAEALERYSSRPPLAVMRADALAAYVEGGFVDLGDGRVRLACSAETEARTFEAGGGLPTEEASAIGVPATVAAGTVVTAASNPGVFATAVAEALPKGRFLSFEDLSHLGPLEAPGAVAAAAMGALLGD